MKTKKYMQTELNDSDLVILFVIWVSRNFGKITIERITTVQMNLEGIKWVCGMMYA